LFAVVICFTAQLNAVFREYAFKTIFFSLWPYPWLNKFDMRRAYGLHWFWGWSLSYRL